MGELHLELTEPTKGIKRPSIPMAIDGGIYPLDLIGSKDIQKLINTAYNKIYTVAFDYCIEGYDGYIDDNAQLSRELNVNLYIRTRMFNFEISIVGTVCLYCNIRFSIIFYNTTTRDCITLFKVD